MESASLDEEENTPFELPLPLPAWKEAPAALEMLCHFVEPMNDDSACKFDAASSSLCCHICHE